MVSRKRKLGAMWIVFTTEMTSDFRDRGYRCINGICASSIRKRHIPKTESGFEGGIRNNISIRRLASYSILKSASPTLVRRLCEVFDLCLKEATVSEDLVPAASCRQVYCD